MQVFEVNELLVSKTDVQKELGEGVGQMGDVCFNERQLVEEQGKALLDVYEGDQSFLEQFSEISDEDT